MEILEKGEVRVEMDRNDYHEAWDVEVKIQGKSVIYLRVRDEDLRDGNSPFALWVTGKTDVFIDNGSS